MTVCIYRGYRGLLRTSDWAAVQNSTAATVPALSNRRGRATVSAGVGMKTLVNLYRGTGRGRSIYPCHPQQPKEKQ